ncbi:conserved hypothetical protein [Frankia canadensis]|uniref:Glyoxalase/fosfomycin resistance/dioxygenase domain-containing protein n=1 Tax=Frankia canadensis TaxID=1836972 RepID=A0A2I2KQT3_9ACTN|nr:conserved hypothetical protein [Frankia canadensis]SOU55321.1 conserved hypothetical protein [Frankia canadensis]
MNNESPPLAQISLLVLYCSDLPLSHDFYRNLGLAFERERHGAGPEHYAAVLAGGAVLELYPAGSGPATGRARVGLTVSHASLGTVFPPGDHVLRDPDGRAVDLHVTP